MRGFCKLSGNRRTMRGNGDLLLNEVRNLGTQEIWKAKALKATFALHLYWPNQTSGMPGHRGWGKATATQTYPWLKRIRYGDT